MDHFVHRFTHRVVRGLLIAVGRPDGRLCCLSKSEAAVLLSAKQVRTKNSLHPHGTAIDGWSDVLNRYCTVELS